LRNKRGSDLGSGFARNALIFGVAGRVTAVELITASMVVRDYGIGIRG